MHPKPIAKRSEANALTTSVFRFAAKKRGLRYGTPRDVAGEVFKMSYSSGTDGRIPVAAIAGGRGKGSVARLLDQILRGTGRITALVLREMSYVNGRPAKLLVKQQAKASKILFRYPQIDALVRTVSFRQVARRGQIENCNVSIIMDRVKEGHVADFQTGISVLKRATTNCFVVALGNVAALAHLNALETRRLIVVGERLTNPAMQAHIKAGGTAVAIGWIDGADWFLLMSGKDQVVIAPATNTMFRSSGRAKLRLQRATLYAIAAAVGLGIPVTHVAIALSNQNSVIEEAQ